MRGSRMAGSGTCTNIPNWKTKSTVSDMLEPVATLWRPKFESFEIMEISFLGPEDVSILGTGKSLLDTEIRPTGLRF